GVRLYPLLAKLVGVGGFIVRAVKADVLPAEVVRHDVDDVGAWSALRGHCRERSPTAAGQHSEEERESISSCMHRDIPLDGVHTISHCFHGATPQDGRVVVAERVTETLHPARYRSIVSRWREIWVCNGNAY